MNAEGREIALVDQGAPASILRIKRDRVRWEMIAEFEPLLERLSEARAEEFQRTPTKVIERCAVAGRTLFIKRYLHAASALRPLKYFFKHPRSWREWRLAHRLERLGVPIVTHLAHGERWTRCGLMESILITEGSAGFAPLRLGTDAAALEIQRALGRLLRRMHEAGVVHTDLHLSNLVYSPDEHEFRLVDLDKIKLRYNLDDAARIYGLAALFAVFPMKDEFFETYDSAYLKHRNEICAAAQDRRKQLIAEAAARILPPRHHSAIEQLAAGGINWIVRREFMGAELIRLLGNPNAILDSKPSQLKHSRSSTVARVSGMVIKRHRPHGLRARTRNALRRSRARRAFQKAYHLQLADVTTAAPVAAGERRRIGVVTESYVVTREIPEAMRLDQWVGDLAGIAGALGAMIGRLHESGWRHLDLQASNILIDRHRRPLLIDMEGLRYSGAISDRQARVDLARLARDPALSSAGTIARIRFIRAYCRARGRTAARWLKGRDQLGGFWRKRAPSERAMRLQ